MFLISSGLPRFIKRDSLGYNLNSLFSFKISLQDKRHDPLVGCGQK